MGLFGTYLLQNVVAFVLLVAVHGPHIFLPVHTATVIVFAHSLSNV